MAVKTKRQQARDEKRIEAAYYRSCSGVQIDIMDIPKLFKLGHELIDRGVEGRPVTDVELGEFLRGSVETFQKVAVAKTVDLALKRGDHIDPGVLKALQSHKTGGA